MEAAKVAVAALFIMFVSAEEGPHLQILPAGPQTVRASRNLVLTCRAQVPNTELVRDLRWLDPRGEEVTQDTRMYTEVQAEDVAISLFIKRLADEDAGQYRCTAVYAGNRELEATVSVSIFLGITWVDAPTAQYARVHTDHKLRCKVQANPAANIDWLKESVIISSGSRYVVETDGLLIKAVQKTDGGTYTCRARVPHTGELEERDIQLDVLEPPSWIIKPFDVEGVEADKVEFKCQALGVPPPSYSWVDRDGLDVSQRQGAKVDEQTGTLTLFSVAARDAGTFTCRAENQAGRVEAAASLAVIIRPKVQRLENVTSHAGAAGARLTCLASGDPLPRIIWRKWSSNEPFTPGEQAEDGRVYVEEAAVEAPDYTEAGERRWQQSSLHIERVRRTDDGLYECRAVNIGGEYYKSGHLAVEFPPTFEDQVITKEWSWDQRSVNLSCLATAIPNATVTWWYRNLEIGRVDHDKNFEVHGQGPLSLLEVAPLSGKYFGDYSCRAENIHGSANHSLELVMAREPTIIQQAVLDRVTSTTLHFRFVPPTNIGGLPLDAYAVEYKETRHEWNLARRRVWPLAETGEYILEDLAPMTTYDLRFGCKNRVGFSPWSSGQQVTMPKRGKPEPPLLNYGNYGLGGLLGDSGILEWDTSKEYLLSWQLPEDNGLPIDMFLLRYFPVRHELSEEGSWRRTGAVVREEVAGTSTRHPVLFPYTDTYIQISLQAHNEFGYSQESVLVIRAVKGDLAALDGDSAADFTASQLPLVPLLGGLVAVLVVAAVLVDLSCYKINKTGVTNFLCEKTKTFKKFDAQSESAKLSGQSLTSTNTLQSQGFGNGIKENSPLLEATPNRVKLVDNSIIVNSESTGSFRV